MERFKKNKSQLDDLLHNSFKILRKSNIKTDCD